MFKIIGGDGNEYGPVSADTLRQWQAQGRVNATTRVKREGGEWATLGVFSEFMGNPQAALAGQGAAAPLRPLKLAPAAAEPDEIEHRPRYDDDNYHIRPGQCVARSWQLFKGNFGVLFSAFLLLACVNAGINLIGKKPFDRAVFGLIALLVCVPLLTGFQLMFVRAARGETPGFKNFFAGCSRFIQLLQAVGAMALGQILCFVPAAGFGYLAVVPALQQHQPPPRIALQLLAGIAALGVLPAIFLCVSWMFTLPLIVDRGLDFWGAMKLSWRRVNVHWWQNFGLLLGASLVAAAGALALGVGIFLSVPVAIGAMMVAYETLFPKNATRRP
ncbi:MAG: hypothetical protein RLZZ350_1729 [Verrucomicrobiota bacterium]|jgi:hypothetical protein